MPSSRRVKLVAVAAVTIILLLVYYKSNTSPQSRYLSDLKAASDREHLLRLQTESLIPPPDHSQDLTDTAGVINRLRLAEDAAKKAADSKGGPKPDSPARVADTIHNNNNRPPPKGQVVEGVYDAQKDLAAMLLRAPVVIFSKSYCPFSKRAKDLLLRRYDITPAPVVVELDQHAHGSALQDVLLEKTGRRTVPNIMIGGKSIGGCDDVVALEREGVLGDTIRKMGGERVVKVLKLKEEEVV